MDKNKVLFIDSAFTVKGLPNAEEAIDSVYIEGYASTNDIDRSGDVVPTKVWEAGLANYLKNPIILAQHDHDDPIGRMTDHRIDSKGLWIKARISAAAECFNLVKDGVLTAFSIGFRILDAEYNSAAEVFMIKELELVEISVVSVPCNQNTLFSLAKAFDNAEEYTSFKKQFAPKGESAKGLESTTEANSTTPKEWKMDPKELEKLLADTTAKAVAAATAAFEAKLATEKAEKDAAEKAEAELTARVQKAVSAQIEVGTSGAEKLLQEVTKRFEDQAAAGKSALEGLESALAEKAEEIKRFQASKMNFTEGKSADPVSYTEKEQAVLLSRITGKALDATKYGQALITKAGGHVAAGAVTGPNSVWELEVSLNMENEIRRRLVIAPNLRSISMSTNVMRIPVNPEAGFATWVANTSFGTTASPGAAQNHQMKELTLSAYKVSTMEYLAYEEEEDSIIMLLPIIRDAMIRRTARAVDKAFVHDTTAPFTGLGAYDTTSAVTVTNTGTVSIANLRALRKDLGVWGLEPQDLRFIVSTETYYDLMEDTAFQTMEKVGSQATILTGMVGAVGNTPVLVSDAFPARTGGTSSSNTNMGAVCIAPANFMVGNQRGLRFDTQDLVETQRKVLVASLRTGLQQFSTVNGMGVSTLRYT